uniref:Na/Pi cotransporter n=1 Tax=Heterorhabditis bacteriophora TaxID=37862 RepID=A0A1I7X978_HETBA
MKISNFTNETNTTWSREENNGQKDRWSKLSFNSKLFKPLISTSKKLPFVLTITCRVDRQKHVRVQLPLLLIIWKIRSDILLTKFLMTLSSTSFHSLLMTLKILDSLKLTVIGMNPIADRESQSIVFTSFSSNQVLVLRLAYGHFFIRDRTILGHLSSILHTVVFEALMPQFLPISLTLSAKLSFLRSFNLNCSKARLLNMCESNSIFNSSLTPLVGSGVISLEQMYPLILGANIGGTFSGVLAALTADGSRLEKALHMAVCQVMYNIIGTFMFYLIPWTRKLPIYLARKLGEITDKVKLIVN